MNADGISVNIVEWDGIARDALMVITILSFLLNAYFVSHGLVRRTKSRDALLFAKAALITSVGTSFLVMFIVTWMMSRALHTAVRVGPSFAAISMLLGTAASYLESIALSLPSIAGGIIGGIALGGSTKRPTL